MVSVAFFTIDNVEGVYLASLQIHHLKVGLWMPDGESAIVGYRIEDVTAIGRDAGMADTCFRLRRHSGIQQGIYLGADSASLFVEGNTDQTVLQVLYIFWKINGVSTAIVDVLAVG